MTLRILKILMLVSYLLIQLEGGHLGGPLIVFLLLSILSDSVLVILGAVVILIALFILTKSIWKPITFDKVVVPSLIFVISIPVLIEIGEIIILGNWSSTRYFQLTFGIFLILALMVTFRTIKKGNTATNTSGRCATLL